MKRLFGIFLLLSFLNNYSQVPSYVPTSGLMGYWPFTGNANDVSGNGHHGTVNGASLTTDRFSASNSAYNFNGSNNYIVVASTSSLSGYSDLTISAWIQIGAFPLGVQGIVTKWYQVSCTSSNANSDTYEGALSNNTVQFATNNNNLTGFTSPPVLSPALLNTWIHLVYTSSSSQGLTIYINGVSAATMFSPGNICASTNPLYFGTDYHGVSNTFHRFFNGKIDDIGIWNRVLTLCEIQQLYTASTGTLNAVSSSSSICSGNQATLTVTGAGSYTWTPGGATASSVVVNPSVTTIYTVTAINSGTPACPVSATILVNVTPTPSLTASSTPTLDCSGATLTITAGGATTYSWVGIGTGSAIVVSPLVPTTYTVLGSNGPCTATLIRFQNVMPGPQISVSSSDTIICLGNTVSLSANGASSYSWQPGNLNGPNVNVSPSVTTVYTVTATNGSSCSASETWTIFVSPSVSLSAQANPSIVCPGNSCTLSASGAVNYTWLPGNLSGASVVVNPAGNTTYSVLGDDGVCSGSTTVNVSMGLQVSIFTSGSLCNNNTIDLSVTPTNSSTVIMWTGPGIIGAANTSSVSINTPGIYSVSLTNTLNGCAGSASINITGSVSPIALSIVPSSTFACFPGPPVNFLVSASANLSWFPPSEVTPNTGPLVSVSPSVTTTYTVLGTLGSCSGSTVITLVVYDTPKVSAASSVSSLCVGGTASLTAEGATDYNWSPGNFSGSSVTVNPYFTTQYTVTGANGNCISTASISLTVFPVPDLLTAVTPPTICIGHTATLTATGASTLAWLLGDPPPVSHTAIISPSTSTTYTIVGFNSFGCSSQSTAYIHVINSPAISVVSSNTSICAGESVTLTASGAITNYTWMPGFQIAPVVVYTPSESVTYTVISGNAICSYAMVPILVNNCVNTAFGITNAASIPEEYGAEFYRIRFIVTANNSSNSDLTNVILHDNLSSTFIYPLTYTIVSPPAILSKNSLLIANPLFNGNSELSLTSALTSTLPANTRDTIAFTVMIDPNGFEGTLKNLVIGFATDKNNIVATDTSNNGFNSDSDSDGDPTNNNVITLIEIELIDLFIPEGFSPDDDGRNDLFIIKGMNGRNAKLTIFNRWGNKVYFREGAELSWDGKANVNSLGHDILPASTYYYILEFTEGKNKLYHGFIVMRH